MKFIGEGEMGKAKGVMAELDKSWALPPEVVATTNSARTESGW